MLPRDYFASNRFLVEERGMIERGANTSAASAATAQIVRVARDVVGRDGLAAVSSFGTASAALLKLVSDVNPAIPVLLVDTGWLFPETLAHRDAFLAKLGLTDVRSITPDPNKLEQRDLCGPLVHQPRCLLRTAQGRAARQRIRAIRGLAERTQAL